MVKHYGLILEKRNAVGQFAAGNVPWSVLNKGRYSLSYANNELRVARSASARRGQKRTPEQRARISRALKGRRLSPEHIKNRTLSQSGANNGAWKGGVTPKNTSIRNSAQYANWRKSVFTRDGYTCQQCKARGVPLHADHVMPFSQFPDLRFEVLNGRTLCVPCHRQTPGYLNNTFIL